MRCNGCSLWIIVCKFREVFFVTCDVTFSKYSNWLQEKSRHAHKHTDTDLTLDVSKDHARVACQGSESSRGGLGQMKVAFCS